MLNIVKYCYRVLRHFQQKFSYIVAVSFIGKHNFEVAQLMHIARNNIISINIPKYIAFVQNNTK